MDVVIRLKLQQLKLDHNMANNLSHCINLFFHAKYKVLLEHCWRLKPTIFCPLQVNHLQTCEPAMSPINNHTCECKKCFPTIILKTVRIHLNADTHFSWHSVTSFSLYVSVPCSYGNRLFQTGCPLTSVTCPS